MLNMLNEYTSARKLMVNIHFNELSDVRSILIIVVVYYVYNLFFTLGKQQLESYTKFRNRRIQCFIQTFLPQK